MKKKKMLTMTRTWHLLTYTETMMMMAEEVKGEGGKDDEVHQMNPPKSKKRKKISGKQSPWSARAVI